jgi:hypothetical protein
MATIDISWGREPSTSRLVRVLLYLADGALGGVVLYLLYLGWQFGPAVARGDVSNFDLGFGLLILVLWGGMTLLIVVVQRSYVSDSRWWHEWQAVRQWSWVVVASAGMAAVYVGSVAVVWSQFMPFFGQLVPILGALIVWVMLFGTGGGLSAEGEIDPESRTLTWAGYEVDLDNLTNYRQTSVGSRSLLFLSFSRVDIPIGRSLWLLLPNDTANAAVPVLEAGLAQEADRGIMMNPRVRRIMLTGGFVLIALFMGFGVFEFLETGEITGLMQGVAVTVNILIVLYVIGVRFRG